MHKRKETTENKIIKTISFKIKSTDGFPIMEAIREYTSYYNRISQWLNNNLLTTKIGDLCKYLPESSKSSNYYEYMTSDDWRNEPMYKMFMKGFHTQHCDNILFNVIKTLNADEYSGNVLGLSETYFRRNGYFQSVVGNYKSKFKNLHTTIKCKSLSETPTESELLNQCIYEIQKNGLVSKKDWEEQIKYLELRGESKQIYLNRLKTLFAYYQDNQNFVNEQMQTKNVEALLEFGGCVRKSESMSMTLMFVTTNNYKVVLNEKRNGYILSYSKCFNIPLYGNRMVLLNGNEHINVSENHSCSLTFKIRNNNLYVDIPVSTTFNKNENVNGKTVGIDVNLKHSIFATNIVDDGKINGYVNIYKELLKDGAFMDSCTSSMASYLHYAKPYVFFMPLELDLLTSRIMKQHGHSKVNNYDTLFLMEENFLRVLKNLEKRFLDSGETQKRIYIENVIKMRAQVKAYFNLKYAYNQYQKEYDTTMGFTDTSTNSKETMDKRRFESPFPTTEVAQEIRNKMQHVANNITACRNNIICYMYKVFENNGYSVIAMEKLESVQMEKKKKIPSVASLLEYHHAKGQTLKELKEKSIYSKIERGYYNFTFNSDNTIEDATLSELGITTNIESEIYNLTLKAIHFADAKDYFVTLSNNGNISVALVPPQFTSQMDSKKHVIYTEKNSKGKETIAEKQKVRPKQEYHINGLNGDYNAACNIAYIFENEQWRTELMYKTLNEYGQPLFETKIKSQFTIINKLKKINPNTLYPIDNSEVFLKGNIA